jgi:hypothetical protein
MSVVELVRKAQLLFDMGTLTKHDEQFVTATVRKFEKGNVLAEQEVSRLRDILDANL